MKGRRAICTFLIAVVCIVVLSGCGNVQNDTKEPDLGALPAVQETEPETELEAAESSAAPETTLATETANEPAPAEEPIEELPWDTETLKNETGKTLIRCIGDQRSGGAHVSFGIVSSNGTTILADPIYNTDDKGYIKTDILTVTHGHADHYNQKLQKKMKGHAKLSYFSPESFTVKDVNVTGIAAAHSAIAINDKYPTNTIYVYELDGLRIAHMGDMGQDELTADQLEKLGQVDIMFTIITNAPFYGSSTEKNIKFIQQLNPKIVIPTHYAEDVLSQTIETLGVKEVERAAELVVTKDDLNDAPMRFIIVE